MVFTPILLSLCAEKDFQRSHYFAKDTLTHSQIMLLCPEGEATPGLLCVQFWAPQYKRHGNIRERPAKGHEDEGTGAPHV